jgi:uncharacterized protein
MKILPLLTAGFFVPLMAQSQATIPPVQPPSLHVSARGEVRVQPDRATVQVAVETRAANAAAAASQNAAIQQRVIAAIRALGIAAEQISTTGYNVFPDYRYDPARQPQLIGYRVNNTVSVEVRNIDQVGPVLDAALGAGANSISGLRFYASTAEAARRDAMARAVQSARLDAEALARAAGGTLGELLEASVGAYYMPPPQPMMERMAAAAAPADTPISPGEQTVAVDVSTRWRFIPAR